MPQLRGQVGWETMQQLQQTGRGLGRQCRGLCSTASLQHAQ